MERELTFTGIGGQGVQLAAQVLARAATFAGHHAQFFGVYQGFMRGGSTDATVVVADQPILTPPIVSSIWGAVVLHDEFWGDSRDKLRPGSWVLVNSSVVDGDLGLDESHRVLALKLQQIAHEAGNPMGLSMVALGALAAATDLVDVEALCEGMRQALPPYRMQHAPRNEAAIQAGFEAAPRGIVPAWEEVPA